MNFMTFKVRKSAEMTHGRGWNIVRVAVPFVMVAATLALWPDAFSTSVTSAAGTTPRILKTNASVGSVWQEVRPQEPVGSTSSNVPAKRPDDPSVASPPSGVFITSPDDYRIGHNDVIEVRVDRAPELSGLLRVNSSGSILLNYIGRVEAVNKTPEELARIIADGLRGDYLKDPHVVVEVKQYNSRAFFIQGSVRNPGMYHIEGPPTLLKLIIIAGGLADSYGSTAFIIREIKDQESPAQAAEANGSTPDDEEEVKPKYELIKRNIAGLFKGAFDQDLVIDPGDVVNIPASEVFFIAGEVNAPGSFPLREGTSLRQAISLAQGTTSEASLGKGLIFRDDPLTGKRQEINVDIADVMNGKKADIAIMPNDTVIVPNSRWKSFKNALLQGFGYGLMRPGRTIRRF